MRPTPTIAPAPPKNEPTSNPEDAEDFGVVGFVGLTVVVTGFLGVVGRNGDVGSVPFPDVELVEKVGMSVVVLVPLLVVGTVTVVAGLPDVFGLAGEVVGPVGAVVVPVGAVVGLPDGAVVGLPDGAVEGLPDGAVEGLADGAVEGLAAVDSAVLTVAADTARATAARQEKYRSTRIVFGGFCQFFVSNRMR